MTYLLGAVVVVFLLGVLGLIGYSLWSVVRGEEPESPDELIDRLKKK